MSTPRDGHWKVKRTIGAVLGDSQKIGWLEHRWLAYTFAISGGIEIDVELAIVQHVGAGHTMRAHSVLRGKISEIFRSCMVGPIFILIMFTRSHQTSPALGGCSRQGAVDKHRELVGSLTRLTWCFFCFHHLRRLSYHGRLYYCPEVPEVTDRVWRRRKFIDFIRRHIKVEMDAAASGSVEIWKVLVCTCLYFFVKKLKTVKKGKGHILHSKPGKATSNLNTLAKYHDKHGWEMQ